MTHGLRTRTHNIRARHRAAPIERAAMGWNNRATRQRGGTARIQWGKQSRPQHRADGATIARRHPHQGRRSKERGRERHEASKHERRDRMRAGNQNEERIASTLQPPNSPPTVSRDGARETRTDPPDGTTNEARDETSRRASKASQHAPHDEMRTPPPPPQPNRQASRPRDTRPQRIRHEPVIDINTDRRIEPSKQERRCSPPHAPPNRVEERGGDRRDGGR